MDSSLQWGKFDHQAPLILHEPLTLNKAHFRLKAPQFRAFLCHYMANASSGFCYIALVKENGQGYNVALNNGGSGPKIRLALVSENDLAGSSWDVRDIIEETFTPEGKFSPEVRTVVDQGLQGLDGSVLIILQYGLITEAHFHKGEIYP